MELKTFIEQSLTESQDRLMKWLDGLTPAEMAWRPGPECNNIGYLVWHLLRVEDWWVQKVARRTTEVYETDGWYQKFGTEAKDHGWNLTPEQLASFVIPDLAQMMGYGRSIRQCTLEFLRGLPDDKFDQPMRPDRPDTFGRMFLMVVLHFGEHGGQIAYLRGLQRGLDK